MRRGQTLYTLVATILLYLSISASFFSHCDARRSMHLFGGWTRPKDSIIKEMKKLRVTKHFDWASLLLQRETMDSSNTNPYVSSPFTLPPYDSLGPISFPQNSPPFCIYPPYTPQPPSTTLPPPIGYLPSPPSPFYYQPPVLPILSPPPSPTGAVPGPPEITPIPNPPTFLPSPPIITPSPPEIVPSPPIYFPTPPPGPIISPPSYAFSPPTFVPSPPTYVFPPPTGFVPSPTTFLPPIVYPPPTGPPPPKLAPSTSLWCVVKPAVPDPIIQEAMNYACGSGADCESIKPSGSCFEPNTLFAHASYAFNSYWQRTKRAGGTCSFGGTAILVTVDPSYDGCHFLYS